MRTRRHPANRSLQLLLVLVVALFWSSTTRAATDSASAHTSTTSADVVTHGYDGTAGSRVSPLRTGRSVGGGLGEGSGRTRPPSSSRRSFGRQVRAPGVPSSPQKRPAAWVTISPGRSMMLTTGCRGRTSETPSHSLTPGAEARRAFQMPMGQAIPSATWNTR